MAMRLAVISDTHGREGWEIPECDVLIHCGDITAGGSLEETSKFASALRLSLILASRNPRVIAVPGNHDGCFQAFPDEMRRIMKANSIDLLIDEGVEIDGKTFWGSPWTPTFMEWHFMGSEDELAEKAFKPMPRELDVLITHGPKYGTLDRLGKRWGGTSGWQYSSLRRAIIERDIKHHFFGHIHNEGGMSVVTGDGMTSYNVAACDEAYNLVRSCRVLDI